MAKIITYDLRKPGTNYDGLIARIKQYTHCKLTETCWLISTTWTTAQIRDDLKRFLDVNDRLFVAELSGNAAWTGPMLSTTESIKKILKS